MCIDLFNDIPKLDFCALEGKHDTKYKKEHIRQIPHSEAAVPRDFRIAATSLSKQFLNKIFMQVQSNLILASPEYGRGSQLGFQNHLHPKRQFQHIAPLAATQNCTAALQTGNVIDRLPKVGPREF